MFLTAMCAAIFGIGIVVLDGLAIALSRFGWLERIQTALGFGDKPEWM